MPEGLMEDPPLAQYFTLAGLTPHIPKEPSETSSRVKQALNKCVGRVTSFQPQMWPSFAMNILKMIAGCPGDLGEVKVRADMWPGGEIVVYCDTTEGAVRLIRIAATFYVLFSFSAAEFQSVSNCRQFCCCPTAVTKTLLVFSAFP